MYDDALIELRRDIHRWPELAGTEQRTAALVTERLRAAGLEVTTGVGGHGVVAVLNGDEPGPTVAYRADLDAVPDTETFDSDFRSRVPGAAHLCGHDIHTTIAVGAAEELRRRRLSRGRVVFIFQPAEENLTGAHAMIEDGVLERTAPQEIYALHCAPIPVGTFVVTPGAGLPGQDHCRILLPPTGGERIAAAVDALSTVRPPQTPEQLRQLVQDLATPDGPLSRYVYVQSFADTDEVRAWWRAWPDDRYPEIRDELRRLADGATIEFPAPPFPAMVSSPELSLAAAEPLRAVGDVVTMPAAYPFNGEDFALFLQRVPGAMIFLGVANEAAGLHGITHAADFGADERSIGLGVRAVVGLLTERLATIA
ncbi:M20 family metallopeptidase [Actinoplanes sp. OR16]|uniref:M20 metallopeptidase family protein n=1 Tax=Actinoplanes sp. OR16 TaxID=946334 RepID=UPI0018D53B05|nr:M20/M25/M40 family metallo-hydrolase [Actinoplanes sp. OR16]